MGNGRFLFGLTARAFAARAALSCALLGPALLPVARAAAAPPAALPQASATLEQCVTSVQEGERSATFAAEMTALPGTVRMAVQFDLQERMPGEPYFHTVHAHGLNLWQSSNPKVKIYKYLKQVSNLSSPAAYRALVRFRWIGAKRHVIKGMQRITPRCVEPATPAMVGA